MTYFIAIAGRTGRSGNVQDGQERVRLGPVAGAASDGSVDTPLWPPSPAPPDRHPQCSVRRHRPRPRPTTLTCGFPSATRRRPSEATSPGRPASPRSGVCRRDRTADPSGRAGSRRADPSRPARLLPALVRPPKEPPGRRPLAKAHGCLAGTPLTTRLEGSSPSA